MKYRAFSSPKGGKTPEKRMLGSILITGRMCLWKGWLSLNDVGCVPRTHLKICKVGRLQLSGSKVQQGGKNSGKGLNNINRNRRSIRLHGYDYSRAGAYFVTICTRNRACLFGEIIDGEMVLDDSGAMVETVWNELPDRFPNIDLDAFIIMPNHIHGIIVLVGAPLVGTHYSLQTP